MGNSTFCKYYFSSIYMVEQPSPISSSHWNCANFSMASTAHVLIFSNSVLAPLYESARLSFSLILWRVGTKIKFPYSELRYCGLCLKWTGCFFFLFVCCFFVVKAERSLFICFLVLNWELWGAYVTSVYLYLQLNSMFTFLIQVLI